MTDCISACGCVGPLWGEPLCPCQMQGKERSAEYKEYMSQESVEKRRQELFAVFSKHFGWKETNE